MHPLLNTAVKAAPKRESTYQKSRVEWSRSGICGARKCV